MGLRSFRACYACSSKPEISERRAACVSRSRKFWATAGAPVFRPSSNTVTGKTNTGSGPNIFFDDVRSETTTTVALFFHNTVPGEGAVGVEAGRIVADWETDEVIFEAGRHPGPGRDRLVLNPGWQPVEVPPGVIIRPQYAHRRTRTRTHEAIACCQHLGARSARRQEMLKRRRTQRGRAPDATAAGLHPRLSAAPSRAGVCLASGLRDPSDAGRSSGDPTTADIGASPSPRCSTQAGPRGRAGLPTFGRPAAATSPDRSLNSFFDIAAAHG